MKDPETAEEWQDAVDGAAFFLAMDSCKKYGLISGGPGINVERCAELLRRGEELGYHPAPMEALCERFLK